MSGVPATSGGKLPPPVGQPPVGGLPSAALPVWTCEFSEVEGTALNALTVGAKFRAQCRGDIPVQWKKETLEVVFPAPEQSFALHVLRAEKLAATEVDLLLTGYKAGEHAPEYVRIVQGADTGFEVASPKWTIQTVLPKDQQPQPYGSFGPWSLNFPIWILIVACLAAALIGLIVVRQLRRQRQRRAILDELNLHKTALTPVNQFYRDARQLRRRLNGVKSVEELKGVTQDLNREFRLYVLRQFLIPTLDWSDRAITDDLRKRHRKVYREAADPFKKTLRELSRLSNQNNMLLADVEQLHRMSLDAVERLENARLASERAKGRGGSLL